MPARLRQLNERTERLSVSTGMSHSFGGASGSGSARFVKETNRSSCSCMIAAAVESASSGVIEPLVSISSVRRSKSTLCPTRVSSTVKFTLRIGEKIESSGMSPIMCSTLRCLSAIT